MISLQCCFGPNDPAYKVWKDTMLSPTRDHAELITSWFLAFERELLKSDGTVTTALRNIAAFYSSHVTEEHLQRWTANWRAWRAQS